jgi:hypothetical protein
MKIHLIFLTTMAIGIAQVRSQTANTSPLPAGETIIGGHLHAGQNNEVWSDASILYFNYRGNAASTRFWNLGNSTGRSIMSLLNSGYIGMGTDAPSSKLHISATNRITALRVYLDGNTTNYLNIGQGTGGAVIDPIGTGVLYLGYDQPTNVILGYAGGNVGINTATPGYKLDVNGTINASSILINGTPFAGGGSQWATSGSNIYYSTAGNVGIGTPTPTGKLDVRGGTTRIINYGTGYNLISGNADPGINDSYFYHLTSTNYHILGSNKNGSGLMRKLGFAIGGGDTESDVKMMIDPSGNVGIGNTNPDAKLTVTGQVHAQEVKVTVNAPGPDYVFEKDYALPSLDQVKTYIEENKHLPEVPSAKEMEKNGVQLGEMNMLLLKKIEELTLYVIEQNKTIKEMKMEHAQELEKLKDKLKNLKK